MSVTVIELNGSQYTKYLLPRVRILEIQFLYQGLVETHLQITKKQKKTREVIFLFFFLLLKKEENTIAD